MHQLGVVLLDERMQIYHSNATWQKLTQFDADDLQKLSIVDLAREDYVDTMTLRHEDLVRGRRDMQNFEMIYLAKDGADIFTNTTLFAQMLNDQTYLTTIVLIEDTSGRKRKDEMVHTVSHDLKNPIGTIMSAMMLLHDHLPDDDEARQLVKLVESSSQRMFEMVTALLDIARIEAGMPLNRHVVSLNAFVESNIQEFMLAAHNKGIDLLYHPPTEDIQVEIDFSQLGQAIYNLLSNAIKYTPIGGQVRVDVDYDDKHFKIRVSDTGYGIPEKDIPYLFEKFHRVDRKEHRAQGGTGLGLAIVKSIINRHGGDVSVSSVLGEGTTFFVSIPAVNSP